ncbi:MAG TPA: hypothetical protein VND45_13770 [Thermoanaerobaculia bacterium]|nr:hypothetical protein [Thermoanaerobaculia bacterium]
MRRLLVFLTVTLVSATAAAQRPPVPMRSPQMAAQSAERAIKQAAERLAETRKTVERQLQVLAEVRAADAALVDSMQPTVAVQAAFEHLQKAESRNIDRFVQLGLIRARQAVEDARKSPGSADFGHLRNTLRTEALGPASRLAVRTATALQDEIMAWMTVQELVAIHLKTLSEITGESLRAAQEE